MCKRLLCVFTLLVLLCSSFNVFASQEASFQLTSVSCEKNRLFETKLSVSCDVAAFVASLDFNQSTLEFRGAKATNQNAELSVNSVEAGKVKIAYLCENGASGELITFTFKSTEQSTSISLNAEQVIDQSGNELSCISLKGADINIEAKNSGNKNHKTDSTKSTDTSSQSTDSLDSTKDNVEYLYIPPESGVDLSLIFCVAGGTVLIFAVAAMAFALGRKTSAKK